MSDPIFPRSPKETMSGWVHLPRYIDKIRLQLAGKLHADYQANIGKGFDGMWLKAAGLTHDEFVEVVKGSITDGQVADWVRLHVQRTDEEKRAHFEVMMGMPNGEDAGMCERFEQRKQASGFGDRDDIRSFVALIEADERRI